MHLKRKKKRGFTLLEVLVVIAIIGILSAMANSSISGKIARERVKGVAASGAAFMSRISAEVKKMQIPYSVRFTATRMSSYASADCSGAEFYGEDIDQVIEIMTQAKNAAAPGNSGTFAPVSWGLNECIAFTPDNFGLNAVATTGYIRVRHKQRPKDQAMFFKSATENPFQTATSLDEGLTWNR